MDARKPTSRRLVKLAYTPLAKPRWHATSTGMPGPMFDAFVVGSFLVLLVGYFL